MLGIEGVLWFVFVVDLGCFEANCLGARVPLGHGEEEVSVVGDRVLAGERNQDVCPMCLFET